MRGTPLDAPATDRILANPGFRSVIAHRGGAGRAPENTLPALSGAAALGADAIELDVHVSRDGEVVVVHDATVDRTTDGRGRVRDRTASGLARLDAGATFTPDGGRSFPFRGRGIGIPRLADVIAAVPDMPLLIEVKVAEALAPTVHVLERTGAVGRAMIAAADWRAVAPARGGGLRTGASSRDAARLLFSPIAPASLPYAALCVPERHWGVPLPMRHIVTRARRAGAVTHVWTVNDVHAAQRYWRMGVAGIITDVPDTMVAARAAL